MLTLTLRLTFSAVGEVLHGVLEVSVGRGLKISICLDLYKKIIHILVYFQCFWFICNFVIFKDKIVHKITSSLQVNIPAFCIILLIYLVKV